MKYASQTFTEEATIELTPLLDVVFILLLFFIVSATFERTQTLDIERPSAQQRDPQALQPIYVSIDAQQVIWLDSQQVSIVDLGQLLAVQASSDIYQQAVVDADQSVPTGLLIQVVDQLRLAGMNHVAVASQAVH